LTRTQESDKVAACFTVTMTHNDVLRSLRYLMRVSDATIGEIIRLAKYEISTAEVVALLKKDDDPGYKECSDQVMAHFLNGLVLYKRGVDHSRPPQPIETPVTNNTILKKLRVAFELKDSDLIELVGKSGLRVSKAELGAFFRRPDHRNYRECKDQFLRNVLKGMSL
jgi:uncharacterized protein YehS (DUF1456 family)